MKEFKIMGIDKWQEAGYLVEGQTFIELEAKNSKHGNQVIEEFLKVAPNAKAIIKKSR